MKIQKETIIPSLTSFAIATVLCMPAVPSAIASPRPGRATAQAKSGAPKVQHDIYGTIRSVEGAKLTIETRVKKTIQVDTKAAAESQRAVVLVVGHAVLVHGTYDTKGVFHASSVQRAKSSPALWPEDK